MLARVLSYGLTGISGYPVQVEVDISNGLPSYETVGLPDAAVRESKERVRSAIKNSGFLYPVSRITVNLAPADLRKEGSVYDLPIAIGILIASGQLTEKSDEPVLILGELALDGEIRPITGVLPMVIDASKRGIKKVILPSGNVNEAAYISGMEIFGADRLTTAAGILSGESPVEAIPTLKWEDVVNTHQFDFADIKGQHGAKRAAEIAAAGGHNMLLIGPPGSGKTMLARSMPSILPDLTFDEALEITKIHSVVGVLKSHDGIIMERPFRSPHHSSSTVSLVGGGQKALPGEISLAHYGVLFLDEFPEFKKGSLEALRQPLEDGEISIARAAATATYPAQFILIAAMNPCPCGNFGSRVTPCRCTTLQIQHYLGRISGPLLDRIDLHVEMSEVGYLDISKKVQSESSQVIRSRVNQARDIQRRRYSQDKLHFNAQLTGKLISKYCGIDEKAENLLKNAFSTLKMSARAYSRILKVARTIADLEQSDAICQDHIAEAIQYRNLDRKYWGK